MVKKISAQLHLWLGLCAGVIVFIVSITGCIYVFNEEFLKLFPLHKHQADVVKVIEAAGRPILKPSVIVGKLQTQAWGDSVKIKPVMIRYIKNEPSLLLAEEKGVNERSWYTFDPYTGQLLDQKLETPYGEFRVKNGIRQNENLRGFEFFPFILQGHQDLWLPTAIGRPIVRYGTLTFVVLLISGLILWWPKTKAAFKQRYWFRWKKSTKWRRKNYDLHNVNGFYMFLFLLIISFTGLCIGLSWVSGGMHKLMGGPEQVVFKSVPPANGNSPDPLYSLDAIFEAEAKQYPNSGRKSMYWSYPSLGDKEATIMTVTYVEKESHRGLYDKYSQHRLNSVTEDDDDDKKDFASKVEELYLPIHEGSIGGLATKFLAFIASFISASLPVTGFYIWWGRRNKVKEKPPRRNKATVYA